MNVGLSSDHRGFVLKEQLQSILKEKGFIVTDYGTYTEDKVDYPVFAFMLCNGVINKDVDFGITICGTGIGMSIACNKVKGIRCAKIDNLIDAKYAKVHNNANVIAFSAIKNINEVVEMIDLFINNEFNSNEKYKRRIQLVEDYENEH